MKPKKAIGSGMKRALFSCLLILFSVCNMVSGLAQALDNATQTQLEKLTYYLATSDKVDVHLETAGYQRPAYISANEWKAFPAIRKMEMAYKAAAVNNQGEAFMKVITRQVAREYNSIKSERSLASKFIGDVPEIHFTNPVNINGFTNIPVPAAIKNDISVIGKYVDQGALGNMQNVMKNYLNLNDELVYDLLAKSQSSQEAFKQGLIKSKVPPPHEAKLSRMARDIQSNYGALKMDGQLSEIAKRKNSATTSFVDDKIKPDDLHSGSSAPTTSAGGPGGGSAGSSRSAGSGSGGGGSGGVNFNEYKERFKKSYTKHTSYESVYKNRSKSFRRMVRFKGGHGGVILGDTVMVNPAFKPVELQWSPIEDSAKRDHKQFGYLEIRFANIPGYKVFGPVLYEDVFAAYAVVHDNRYQRGNGIGMVSVIDTSNINFSNGSRRYGITLHPAVSHLRLGWAFVIADALAISKNSFEEALSGDSEAKSLIEGFYRENNSTWKVTDKPIRIKIDGNRIVMDPIVLTMWGFRNNADTPTLSRYFDRLMPTICDRVQEFKRINEFAKVLALFRWAKMKQSKFINITKYNSFIKQPVCVYVNSEKELLFPDRKNDEEQIQLEKNLYQFILDSSINDPDRNYSVKIKSLQNWLQATSGNRKQWWSTAINTPVENLSPNPAREDATGFSILKEIDSLYDHKFSARSVQQVNPDSVDYYLTLSLRVKRAKKPFIYKAGKIDSLENQASSIIEKYANTPVSAIPSQVRLKLYNLYLAIDNANLDYARALQTPSGKTLLEDLSTLASFEYRNKVLRSINLYYLLQAEKKAILDYFE